LPVQIKFKFITLGFLILFADFSISTICFKYCSDFFFF
jgi:hypothetical protein